ncbi:mCG141818, partial [Mus musculus]
LTGLGEGGGHATQLWTRRREKRRFPRNVLFSCLQRHNHRREHSILHRHFHASIDDKSPPVFIDEIKSPVIIKLAI